MLSADNLLQSNSGTFTGTSGTASLGAGTEAGNTVLLAVYTIGTGTISTPTGFVLVGSLGPSNGHAISLFIRSSVPAGETSWTVGVSVSQLTDWVTLEYAGIDVNSPVIGSVSTDGGGFANTSSLTVTPGGGTGSGVASDDMVSLAFYGAFQAGATAPALATFDSAGGPSPNTLASAQVVSGSGTGGGNAAAVMVGAEYPQGIVWYLTTQVASVGPPSKGMALGVSLRAAGGPQYPALTHILGAQHGTSAGWTTGNAGFTYLASASAGVSITTSNPRHDTYAFRCNATTTACNFTSSATTIAAGVFVGRFSFRLNTTPGANLELGGVTGTSLTFRYITGSGLIGCKVGTGTEQTSAAAVSAGNWYSINFRLDTSTTSGQCEWSTRADSTATLTTETTATGTVTASTSFTPQIGWTTATTGDVNFADVVCSSTAAAYPLGDYQVRVMKVDGTRAAVDPSTPAAFNQFTANGTMAAWSGANAPTRMDELPATIGATADGLAQITAAADFAGVYFETLDLGATGSAKGARCCAVGWAASATAATIEASFQMGTAVSVTYAPVADYNFDNSTTAPAWLCSGVRGSGGASSRITRAILTNNVGSTHPGLFMFGNSTDATPDVGFHAVYIELAVKMISPVTLQRGPDGNTMVALYQDSDTSGYVGLQFTAPADRGMSYSYEFPSGTTNGPTTLAAGASSSVIALDAALVTSTPRVNCTLDPAP